MYVCGNVCVLGLRIAPNKGHVSLSLPICYVCMYMHVCVCIHMHMC